ncbi:MAG: hypothetical protein ABIY55_03560, partial [Kofleriaceae bacterium]
MLLPASLLFSACSPEALSSDPPAAEPGTAMFSDSLTIAPEATGPSLAAITEAPAGFDNLTNGFLSQADFDTARDVFEEIEALSDGLGPVYNAQSCRECHQNPVTGAGSQITEFRAGHFNGASF